MVVGLCVFCFGAIPKMTQGRHFDDAFDPLVRIHIDANAAFIPQSKYALVVAKVFFELCRVDQSFS